MRSLTCALIICLLASAGGVSSSATALEFRVRPSNVLALSGEFEVDDEKRFQQALDRNPEIEEIWFDSPGGILIAALAIGKKLRNRGLATRIVKGAECASACPYAFVGGVVRAIDPGAKVGVHMATLTGNDDLINSTTLLIMKYGPDAARSLAAMFEQRAAKSAYRLARYLMEMRVSLELMTLAIDTDNEGMYYLSREEMRRYNLINQ
jgi:hypothetical protein